MVNTAIVTEVLEEKMPESPWHAKVADAVKELVEQAVTRFPDSVVFRDLFFRFEGKRYGPDIAVVLKGAPPIERIGLVYRVPEDGPAPDAIIEVAVSPKSLGEALSDKADFYSSMGVKDYLVVEAFPDKPMRLWFCRLDKGETLSWVNEAKLETLKITVRAEGQRLRVFDEKGQEILPLRERMAMLEAALQEERKKREELERRLKELEQGKK
ncbi:putative restriction endonuclease [Candidatus Fervidibacteria bacterium JGI MDM2 JNZ-1-D12]